VICFQYRSDAIRVQDALRLRLGKFGLTLEPTKTKLVEFGVTAGVIPRFFGGTSWQRAAAHGS